MNFEIKSTFRYTARALAKGARILVRHYALILLLINVSVCCVLTHLYLGNQFIPAVYGSKPTGSLWIRLFSLLALLWTASTGWAATALFMRVPALRNLTLGLYETVIHYQSCLNEILRRVLLRIFLVLSMALHSLQRRQKAVAVISNTPYHHESKTHPARVG